MRAGADDELPGPCGDDGTARLLLRPAYSLDATREQLLRYTGILERTRIFGWRVCQWLLRDPCRSVVLLVGSGHELHERFVRDEQHDRYERRANDHPLRYLRQTPERGELLKHLFVTAFLLNP